MVRLVPYKIRTPADRHDKLVGIIVKTIAKYSESLNDQVNLSSLPAQEIMARQIILALDREGRLT